ncbi:hypothetical protein B0H14DRAFT_2597470 [Mycena olivaceomarginata]|nr:hypothetical protein B0H14DRAFT_2597470 [Mycena olivaceomarginata]
MLRRDPILSRFKLRSALRDVTKILLIQGFLQIVEYIECSTTRSLCISRILCAWCDLVLSHYDERPLYFKVNSVRNITASSSIDATRSSRFNQTLQIRFRDENGERTSMDNSRLTHRHRVPTWLLNLCHGPKAPLTSGICGRDSLPLPPSSSGRILGSRLTISASDTGGGFSRWFWYTISTWSQAARIAWTVEASFVAFTAIDMIISVAMCYYLRKSMG